MSALTKAPPLRWESATGLSPLHDKGERCPQGMLVSDIHNKIDRVAVVYEKGNPPPEITICEVSGSVHSVLADGIAVAVVARATGPALSAEDVLLVERTI